MPIVTVVLKIVSSVVVVMVVGVVAVLTSRFVVAVSLIIGRISVAMWDVWLGRTWKPWMMLRNLLVRFSPDRVVAVKISVRKMWTVSRVVGPEIRLQVTLLVYACEVDDCWVAV